MQQAEKQSILHNVFTASTHIYTRYSRTYSMCTCVVCECVSVSQETCHEELLKKKKKPPKQFQSCSQSNEMELLCLCGLTHYMDPPIYAFRVHVIKLAKLFCLGFKPSVAYFGTCPASSLPINEIKASWIDSHFLQPGLHECAQICEEVVQEANFCLAT